MTLKEAEEQLAAAHAAYENAKRTTTLCKTMHDFYKGQVRIAIMRFDSVVNGIKARVQPSLVSAR